MASRFMYLIAATAAMTGLLYGSWAPDVSSTFENMQGAHFVLENKIRYDDGCCHAKMIIEAPDFRGFKGLHCTAQALGACYIDELDLTYSPGLPILYDIRVNVLNGSGDNKKIVKTIDKDGETANQDLHLMFHSDGSCCRIHVR